MGAKAINKFMHEALEMANLAFQNSEVPVGAIIVKDETVVGRGFNQVISSNSVVAHAEINAIESASKELNNYRLNVCKGYCGCKNKKFIFWSIRTKNWCDSFS